MGKHRVIGAKIALGFPELSAANGVQVLTPFVSGLERYLQIMPSRKTRCGSLGETAKPARPLTCRAAAHGFRLAG